MTNIPRSIIEQFEKNYRINSLVLDDFSYTSQVGADGDFHKYIGKELAVYRMAVLLSTMEGSDMLDPQLGLNLLPYIYREMIPSNISAIKNEIVNKIAKYEKDLQLINIIVDQDYKTKSIHFKLYLKYTPSQEDIVLDFEFIKTIQALMLRSR